MRRFEPKSKFGPQHFSIALGFDLVMGLAAPKESSNCKNLSDRL